MERRDPLASSSVLEEVSQGGALASILPSEVSVVASRCEVTALLWPNEERVMARAVTKRKAEFTTGRACARSALGHLGVEPVEILKGECGEPLWPRGVVGSITHCRGYRAAAVARSERVQAIGIDAEPHEPLPPEVRPLILTDQDAENIRELTGMTELTRQTRGGAPVHWDRMIFCAKEAIYKAWFPIKHRWLGFEEVSVYPKPDGGFRAQLPTTLFSEGNASSLIEGRWVVDDGVLLAAIAVVPLNSAEIMVSVA